MRKIAEKVAIVAQICITLIFVLISILYITGVIGIAQGNNSVVIVLMCVLAGVYVALSAYILYMNFSERENIKDILLFCDNESATRTNIKVINNIVKGCTKEVEGVVVRKVRVRSDEKGGFVAIVSVKVSAENVAPAINKLRCLLADSFKNTLGLVFNTINFNIEKLNGKYAPNVKEAEKSAEKLQESQKAVEESYSKPLEKPATETDAATVASDVEENTQPVQEAEPVETPAPATAEETTQPVQQTEEKEDDLVQ